MKLYVLRTIKLKKAGRLFDIKKTAAVSVSKPDSAQALLDSGHVRACQPGDIKKPFAARIYSKILNDEIWVVTSPEAIAFVPDDTVTYLPEEIQNLRGSTPDEIKAIHMIKKSIGGKLIAVEDCA